MKDHPIRPRPPVGPWIETQVGYVESHGIRYDRRVARLVEAHVGWHVSVLLVDPAVSEGSKRRIREVFFEAGVASIDVPSAPPHRSSEAATRPDAPPVPLWHGDDEGEDDDEEEEDEADAAPRKAPKRRRTPRRRV